MKLCFCLVLGVSGLPLAASTTARPAAAPDPAAVPGVAEALSPQVTPGPLIDVPGPPSADRHPAVGDPQRLDNSVAKGHLLMQPRRELADGAYQECRRNWLITQFPEVDLATIAAQITQRYEQLVLAHVPSPRLTAVEVEPLTLVYPAGYGGNDQPVRVRARRLVLRAVDRFGDPRHLVAYYLNYDRVEPGRRSVILQVNGHFGRQPSRMIIGLAGRGGISGAAVGLIALRGYPIMTYDDHDVGESSPATGNENGLHRTLANLRMIDDALLVHFDRVDVIGLSGGTERLYHFLAFHRCPIGAAYLSGFANSPWTGLDSRHYSRGPFGINPDTHEPTFLANFQWADLVLVGISQGIDVCLAQQTYEGGEGKECMAHEILPALRRYTDRFVLGGDDRDGDGVSDDGRDLAHEYDLPDFYAFLEASRAAR